MEQTQVMNAVDAAKPTLVNKEDDMEYSISPGVLADKVQELDYQIETIQSLAGCTPDFLEENEASEVLVTSAAMAIEELLHAIAMASMKLRLIRARARGGK